MSYLLECNNLTKNFENKNLIENVSFKIIKGTLTTIIGPNGAGKTTLAKIILGLVEPSKGKIDLQNNITLGYVPQKMEFDFSLPVNAEYFLSLLTSYGNNRKAKIANDYNIQEKILKFADFDNIKKIAISSLSRGQLQKLLLAASFLRGDDLLILDEPTCSLDIISSQEFYYLIEYLKKYNQNSFLIISHDLNVVLKNSDQVLCLNGHICCAGVPENSKDFAILNSSGFSIYEHHHDHKH